MIALNLEAANVSEPLGIVLSVLGLLVSAVGLWFTYAEAKKARIYAMDAKRAAEAARRTINRADTVSELGDAIAAISEVRRYARQKHWSYVPDRADTARMHLSRALGLGHDLPDALRERIGAAIGQLKILNEMLLVEGAVEGFEDSRSRMITTLGEVLDDLQVLHTQLQPKVSGLAHEGGMP